MDAANDEEDDVDHLDDLHLEDAAVSGALTTVITQTQAR
jgi:hypothetical protein